MIQSARKMIPSQPAFPPPASWFLNSPDDSKSDEQEHPDQSASSVPASSTAAPGVNDTTAAGPDAHQPPLESEEEYPDVDQYWQEYRDQKWSQPENKHPEESPEEYPDHQSWKEYRDQKWSEPDHKRCRW